VWTIGYVLLVVTTLGAALLMLRHEAPTAAPGKSKAIASGPITWSRRLRWVLLAFVPSSLMLGVTHHITTDVAAVPLLWVIPLLLYLVSMIVAFSTRVTLNGRAYGTALPWLAIPVSVVILMYTKEPISLIVALHLAFMFVASLMCHRLIAEDRPDPSHLTEFYLLMAVGGVLGGVFNGLLAPMLFDRLLEYPIIIGVALLVRPQAWGRLTRAHLGLGIASGAVVVAAILGTDLLLARYPKTDAGFAELLRVAAPPALALVLAIRTGGIRLAFAVLAIGVTSLYTFRHGHVIHNERTFFGVHQVVTRNDGNWHVLMHGTTAHGFQAQFEPGRFLPTSYYHRTGPVQAVFAVAQSRGPVSVSVLGLGTGTVASYGREGDAFRFFEIDPAVGRIALNTNYFTYLADYQRAIEKIVIGDGRLLMEGEPENSSDIIMLDAFTSDAVPVHLMTREAFTQAYLPKLKPGGMILVNTSNRHLDFWPVLARIADDLNLVAFACADKATPEQALEGKQWSKFVVIARAREDLGPIATNPAWRQLASHPGDPLWTDDFSNLLSVFSWR